MSDYTAADIRILPPDEVSERWDWALAGALAAQYGVPEDAVQRGLEACERACVDPSHYVLRYLVGDRSEPAHPGVQEAMRELLTELRDARQPGART